MEDLGLTLADIIDKLHELYSLKGGDLPCLGSLKGRSSFDRDPPALLCLDNRFWVELFVSPPGHAAGAARLAELLVIHIYLY
jgi:hypothetical protein